MSISQALSNAVSGMQTASRFADVASHNIANATTEGYVRQSVHAIQRVTGEGKGAGVYSTPVQRETTPWLTNSRREATGDNASANTKTAAAARIAAGLGDPDGADSIFARIDALETSLRALSETPESTAIQQRTLGNLKSVTEGFSIASDQISAVRNDADQAIAKGVKTVNTALHAIERLNTDISEARIYGRDSAAFEQARADELDIIAEQLDVRILQREHGAIAIYTAQGVSLLDGHVNEIQFTPVPEVRPEADYRAGTGALSGLSVKGVEITPDNGTRSITSGALAANFAIRDDLALTAQTELDALAGTVARRFEVPGIAAADGTGLFTDQGAAIGAAETPGLAGRLEVSAAVDPAQGGAVWRLRDGLDAAAPGTSLSSGFAVSLLDAMTETGAVGGGSSMTMVSDLKGLAGELASLFETQSLTLEQDSARQIGRLEALKTSESAASGVDIDEELQSLLLIEQSYAANARVIEVADRLIQRLLEI